MAEKQGKSFTNSREKKIAKQGESYELTQKPHAQIIKEKEQPPKITTEIQTIKTAVVTPH